MKTGNSEFKVTNISDDSSVTKIRDTGLGSSGSAVYEKAGETYFVKEPTPKCMNTNLHMVKVEENNFVEETVTITDKGPKGETLTRNETRYVSADGFEQQNALLTAQKSQALDAVYRKFMPEGSVPGTECWVDGEKVLMASKAIPGFRSLEECTNTNRFSDPHTRENPDDIISAYKPEYADLSISDLRPELTTYKGNDGTETDIVDGKVGNKPIKGLMALNLVALLVDEEDLNPTNIGFVEKNDHILACKIDNKYAAGAVLDDFFEPVTEDSPLLHSSYVEMFNTQGIAVTLNSVVFSMQGEVGDGKGVFSAFSFPFSVAFGGKNEVFTEEFLEVAYKMVHTDPKEIGDIFRSHIDPKMANAYGDNVAEKLATTVENRFAFMQEKIQGITEYKAYEQKKEQEMQTTVSNSPRSSDMSLDTSSDSEEKTTKTWVERTQSKTQENKNKGISQIGS